MIQGTGVSHQGPLQLLRWRGSKVEGPGGYTEVALPFTFVHTDSGLRSQRSRDLSKVTQLKSRKYCPALQPPW